MQANLFSPFADHGKAATRDLFAGQAIESDQLCGECERRLVLTASGYLCCPVGHGKLLPDRPADSV